MSRHEIPAKNPTYKVIVGWDQPLLTFFAQVIDRDKEDTDPDNKMILWEGCMPGEIPEIDNLAKILSRYAVLSPDIRAKLYIDRDNAADD